MPRSESRTISRESILRKLLEARATKTNIIFDVTLDEAKHPNLYDLFESILDKAPDELAPRFLRLASSDNSTAVGSCASLHMRQSQSNTVPPGLAPVDAVNIPKDALEGSANVCLLMKLVKYLLPK
jgi:hypothetical protein